MLSHRREVHPDIHNNLFYGCRKSRLGIAAAAVLRGLPASIRTAPPANPLNFKARNPKPLGTRFACSHAALMLPHARPHCAKANGRRSTSPQPIDFKKHFPTTTFRIQQVTKNRFAVI